MEIVRRVFRNSQTARKLGRSLVDWNSRLLSGPQNVTERYSWILQPDSPAQLPCPKSGPLKINWVIPGPARGSGGHFNIFRTILQFEEWGHQQHIYVNGPVDAATSDQVRKNYFPIRTPIESLRGPIADSDALIATHWETAYPVRSIGNTARKFYLIQDLEYMFFPPGSLYEFARHTYELGYFGITAGKWIAETLAREFGMECSSFGFSYDRNHYTSQGPRFLTGQKRRILFYARPETERRGFELGMLALSLVAEKHPEVEFVLVGFSPSSHRVPFPAVFPGVLHLDQLSSLYRSCDLALVLSHTNLSLLPLELMASGCPVVSNSGPNVEWLLTEGAVQFAKPVPQALAEALNALLENEALRRRKTIAGLKMAENTSWTTEIGSIEAGLYRGLGIAIGTSNGG